MTFKVAAAGVTPPAWRRWAVPGLIGSLMLNLALVGAFAGSALVSHRHPGGHGMAPPVRARNSSHSCGRYHPIGPRSAHTL